jgi:hypothetical protein
MARVLQASTEPPLSAPAEAWRSWIRELIGAGQFSRRFLSWVCVRESYFLKIPRVHGEIEADLRDGAAEAEREYRLTRQLAEHLDGMIDPPLRLIEACIVKRRLTGADLWALASREGATPRVRTAIVDGVKMAARLHLLDPGAVPGLPVHDYADDPYLPAPERLRDRLRRHPRTIVLTGLEVRNFKQACAGGPWQFFDPHRAVLGAPEDDFARYVLSLLMITWGRHARCRIWTRFDYGELVRAYEAERGDALDRELLAYMFQRNIAMRRFEVRGSTRDLPWMMQAAARAYEALFFWQVGMWGSRHGL